MHQPTRTVKGILTRRVEEDIQIAPDVIVKILGTEGNRVTLGITAPKCIGISRLTQLPEEWKPYIGDWDIKDGELPTGNQGSSEGQV